MIDPRIEWGHYAGHRIWYRIAGNGPAMVLIRQNRVPRNDHQLELFADRFTVVQITPIGFGASDRPADYPEGGIAPQILSVLDHEEIDRFAVWGYSQGGAMAAVLAQATPRATAMITGGNPLIGTPTPGTLRRLDRDPRLPVGAHRFWRWFASFDWERELTEMACLKIAYFGSGDHPRTLRRRDQLIACEMEVIDFAGLDHRTCEAGPAVAERVVPTILDRLDAEFPHGW